MAIIRIVAEAAILYFATKFVRQNTAYEVRDAEASGSAPTSA